LKLGLLTAAFPGQSLEEVAGWAAHNGISMLEVACWPPNEGAARRYSGVCHIDVTNLSENKAKDIVAGLAALGTTISALGYYPNPLDPDPEQRGQVVEHLRAVIKGASRLGAPVVNTFIGNDRHATPKENFRQFQRTWPDIVRFAADHGVKVAIENCPMIFSDDEWPGGCNLAFSPAVWRAMFETISDEALGLNLDPSHLLWQMIDVGRVVDEFGPRIYHVHAKDMEIDRDGLYDHGVMSLGVGWQRPRLPGMGEVDFPRFISALYRNGYDYVMCMEHEDRSFEGSVERVRSGFLLARDFLSPWMT
jgi:sugar phosphate isomerase/epimerase